MASGYGKLRLQSAMEYLMTYGWAILAIAIVMVSLYSLGIFNLGNLSPTATTGSCQVIRTAAQTSLAGQCNNMIPKYVGQFNGQTSYVQAPDPLTTSGVLASGITFSAWIKATATAANAIVGQNSGTGCLFYCNGGLMVNYVSGKASMIVYNGAAYISANSVTTVNNGQWYHIVGVFNASQYVAVYVNGNKEASSSTGGFSAYSNRNFLIGLQDNATAAAKYFSGSIADVQIYNTSLDNASVKVLYQKGIGGAPIDLQHLVGWWPLNGNANDYSGSNRNGAPTSIVWNANWQTGYALPKS